MSNDLTALIEEIQFRGKFTLEEIASRIGYSRPHLNKEKLKGSNKKLEGMLRAEFKEILQNVPQSSLDAPLPSGDLNLTLRDYIDLLKENERKAQEHLKRLEAILEGQINRVATNSDLLLAGLYKVSLETEAMGTVALESLARLERKPEAALKKEADKRKRDKILAAQKQGMKP